ncbi:hypothetical protein D3C76_1477480 [compost metagenome]
MVLLQPLPSAFAAFEAILFVFEPLEITVPGLVSKPVIAKALDFDCFLYDIDIPEIKHGDEVILAGEVYQFPRHSQTSDVFNLAK